MAAMIKDMKSVSQDINMSPSPSMEETDFDIFGKHVAAQLKKLSEEQSVIAQSEIQKILSNCRLADIQKRTNMNIYPNAQFTAFHQSSPQSQYLFTPSPANSTSSNSSLGFYPPGVPPVRSSHSSLGFYPPQPNQMTPTSSSSEQISTGPTYVDPSQVIITTRMNNNTMINDEDSSEANNIIARAFDIA